MIASFVIAISIVIHQGGTYPVIEQDAYEEMKIAASKLNIQQVEKELKKKAIEFVPPDLVYVPPAIKNTVYRIDPTYVLEFDITYLDKNGKLAVLYPKGYSFNPLLYIKGPFPPIVVFDGHNKNEIYWVKQYIKQYPNAMLLTVTPSWKSISEQLGVPVYYLKKIIADRFKIKNTISVITVENSEVKVRVYAVNKSK